MNVSDNMLIQITILFMFIGAHGERKFPLYVKSMQAIGPIFFAVDHFNYARLIPIHIQYIMELPAQTLDAFTNISSRSCLPIAVDQGHEQLNKMLMRNGGIIGLTQDPESHIKCSLYGPILNRLITEFEDDSGKANEHDSGVSHHDEGRKRQDDFSVNVHNLVDVLRSRGDPFVEAGVDLVNLDEESVTQRMYRRSMTKARISTISLSMT